MTLSSKIPKPSDCNAPDWRDHWRGMPEFIQDDKGSHHSLMLHFQTADDLEQFRQMTGRTVTTNTKSFWLANGEWINPKCSPRRVRDWRYVDESPVSNLRDKQGTLEAADDSAGVGSDECTVQAGD